MKVAAIGSCLSNLTIANLCQLYDWRQTHSVHHKRSDAFYHYFIKRDWTPPPLDALEHYLRPKEPTRQTAEQFLRNQYERYVGFHDLSHLRGDRASPFIDDLRSTNIDVFLIDNLNDVASLLSHTNKWPGHEEAGLFLNAGFYENEEEIAKEFHYGEFLTPQESVNYTIRIVEWLKSLQPSAKIFILPYHSFTSINDKDRQQRLDDFAELILAAAQNHPFEVVPYLTPPMELTKGLDDWPHFSMPVYRALAGYIYLRTLEAIPAAVRAPSEIVSPSSPPNSDSQIKIQPNPYAGLPDSAFWRRSISGRSRDAVDPVGQLKFGISPSDTIVTAGSCFAQHISNVLVRDGYNYFVSEPEPLTAEAENEGYGVYPARFGNIYSTSQLLQLIKRAFSDELDESCIWRRSDGRYIDGLRPNIQQSGFASPGGLLADRSAHLGAVRRMFEKADIFVFTLGLTETWRDPITDLVVPFAPGAVKCEADQTFSFHNNSVANCVEDFDTVIAFLKNINPALKILLTVSPVPLIATYENQHVLVSNTISKSILRVSANEISKKYDFVEYFPSFEIICGSQASPNFYEADLREPTREGVDYVMQLFRKHFLAPPAHRSERSNELKKKYLASLQHVICDEEILEQKFKDSEAH